MRYFFSSNRSISKGKMKYNARTARHGLFPYKRESLFFRDVDISF